MLESNLSQYGEDARIEGAQVDPRGVIYNKGRDFEDFLNSKYFLQTDLKQRADDLDAMREVTSRVRKQVRSIIRSLRHWQESHCEFENNTRLRYSAYEGALCYSDLRRHWTYYRHAMAELRGMN